MRYLLIIGVLLLSGCNTTAIEKPPARAYVPALTQYLMGIGDVLRITVWREPSLSTSAQIRPDGKISVPLAGEFIAVGLTPLDLAENIRIVLEKYLTTPIVSISPTQLNSQSLWLQVRVSGEVKNTNSYAYQQGMTVLDLILVAGGVSDFSAPNRTHLYRKSKNDAGEVILGDYRIRLGDILYDGKFETNYPLQAGDIIIVPKRYF